MFLLLEAPGEDPSCLFQVPGLQAFIPGLWPHPSKLCLCALLCVCLNLFLSFEVMVIGSGSTPIQCSLNRLTSAKTLFPNKVPFSGSSWTWVFGETLFNQYVVKACFPPVAHGPAGAWGILLSLDGSPGRDWQVLSLDQSPGRDWQGQCARAFSACPPASDAPSSVRPDCPLPRCAVSVGRWSATLHPTISPAPWTAHTGAGLTTATGQLWGLACTLSPAPAGVRKCGGGALGLQLPPVFSAVQSQVGLHPPGLPVSCARAGHKVCDSCLFTRSRVAAGGAPLTRDLLGQLC